MIWIFEGGKTLCEVLTVADAIPLLMAGPRVDDNLLWYGSVRPFLQRDGNRTGGRSFGVLDPAHG